MTRRANRLISLMVPSVVLLCGTAMAMAPSAPTPDQTTLGDQARSAAVVRIAKQVLIRGGCPYNLDKVCDRNRRGKLVHCHCQS